ncbi:anionic trypsin-2-like [Convolutriloba macropyga]|uniref:anionic trypsin-2-like n=1 Tax=Convolutriloba macropyga TaxID=536237 RepID=UPI003F51FB73
MMTDRPTSTIAFTIFLLQFISSTCLVAQNTSKSSSSLRKGRRSGTEFQCGQAPLLEDDETPIVLRRAQILQVVSGQLPGYQTNIVNGQSAPRQGAYPFVVNIKIEWQHWCGGALYDKETVISAAHCFWPDMGTLQLFFADYHQKLGYNYEPGQEKRFVRSITQHPLFDGTWFHNDIAILKLTEPLEFTEKIQPICLPSVEVTGGEQTLVLGWGYTQGTNDEDVLNVATVPIIPRATCSSNDWYSFAITESMLCAGFPQGGVDACQGDSGGPLVLQNSAGAFELIGLVSWGSGCAKAHSPGVYTDVYDYISWIKSVAGEPKYF